MSDERRTVELAPHDPAWAATARAESERLKGTLGPTLIVVHHIGSTSIPGIKAKPIVDLMPLVRSLDDLDAQAERIKSLGYDWRGEFGIAGRRFCTLNDEQTGKRAIHVHFFADGWPDTYRHLNFRDYLKAHPDEARLYEAQKLSAAARHPNDVEAYTDAKGPWIQACEHRASAWALARNQAS